MNKIVKIKSIKNKIYVIRGQQVMLDVDLAEIYGYEVKRLNEQVKRNIERFPEDFVFQLDAKEIPTALKSQFATLNDNGNKRGLHIKKMPYAFTEQGIYMLATVLKGKLATQQSIFIMRTFKEMRHYIAQNQQLVTRPEMKALESKVNKLSNKQSKDYKEIRKSIDNLSKNFIDKKELKEIVILDNQKFEADVAYTQIYKQAKKTIYVIDDYVSIDTLRLLSHKSDGVDVILFTDNKKGAGGSHLTSKEINDFNNEYPTLTIKPNGKVFHDRFIILDYKCKSEIVYHCGASSKDAGNKVCAISRLNDALMMHPKVNEMLSR